MAIYNIQDVRSDFKCLERKGGFSTETKKGDNPGKYTMRQRDFSTCRCYPPLMKD
jgi:hypothetical protein